MPKSPNSRESSTCQKTAVCAGSTYQAAIALRSTGPVKATASADNSAATIGEVQVYPNPADNAATLRFTGTTAGRASVYVTDILGNRMLTIMQNELVTEGQQQKASIHRHYSQASTNAC